MGSSGVREAKERMAYVVVAGNPAAENLQRLGADTTGVRRYHRHPANL